jgi:acetyl/propionyl-CoA carboxylase alpha subunit
MGEAAVSAARACGYVNAGTVEFLVDVNREFYFLEMNTRLQVEHPVTEMVTGIDLVKAQIRVAEGEPLPFTQEDIVLRGHAVEARLSAEDVRNNFLPSTGTIVACRPSHGFGIRDDSGIATGSEISIHYDPMFAKLIAWGTDRNDAIRKLDRALDDYRVVGVDTTIPFCRFVLSHPAFTSGEFNINFVQEHYKPELLAQPSEAAVKAAAIASVILGAGKNRTASHAKTASHTGVCSPWVLQNRGVR